MHNVYVYKISKTYFSNSIQTLSALLYVFNDFRCLELPSSHSWTPKFCTNSGKSSSFTGIQRTAKLCMFFSAILCTWYLYTCSTIHSLAQVSQDTSVKIQRVHVSSEHVEPKREAFARSSSGRCYWAAFEVSFVTRVTWRRSLDIHIVT